MRVRDAVEAYSYAILHHTDETQRWYLGRLGKFIRWCENTELHQGRELYLQDITTTELRKYVHYLSTIPSEGRGRTAQKLSSNTIHGHARAVRTFLNWCSQEEGFDSLVSEKTTRRMNMPHIDQKVIEIFSDAQIRALFAACKREYSEHIQVRDTAILSVLLDTGIRAAELCSLTLEQVHLDPHDSYIKVFGKGRKEREIGLGIEARRVLHKYVRSYRNYTHTVPASERHVFLSRFSKPLTVNGLDQIIYRLGRWAHITGVRCSAHTWRHTFAVNYLKSGGDVFKLSRLLGHSSVQITTDVYLRAFHSQDARADRRSVLDNL